MNVSDYATITPQLCKQSAKNFPSLDVAVDALTKQGYHFEIKFDGVRCMALIDGVSVTLINRTGRDITQRYPDVIAELHATFKGDRQLVLDGELVCYGRDGKPDFAGIHLRDAQSRPIQHLIELHPATFMAFDCLYFEGDDIRMWPWKARNRLARVEAKRSETQRVQWSQAMLDGPAMWAFVKDNGLEGLVAKHPNKPYRSGDRNDWIKIKQAFTVSCLVGRWDKSVAGQDRPAYNAGKGNRANTIGALNLTLIDNGRIVDFGQCGTGFTNVMLDDLKQRLDAGQTIVVDVEINAVTKDTKPRHPTYRGIRMDIPAADCNLDQLDAIPVI